jgi:DNA-binding MarR family transcriptional regulator
MELVQTPRTEQELAQLISKVFIHLDDSDRQLMRQFGLTVTQYWALVHLHDKQGRSLSELANLLICDKSNVTSVVDKLEESGLAERKRGKAGDRRYTRVVLTVDGQLLRERVMAAREHLLEKRLGVITVDDLHQLIHSLKHLADTLQIQFDEHQVEQLINHAVGQGRAVV